MPRWEVQNGIQWSSVRLFSQFYCMSHEVTVHEHIIYVFVWGFFLILCNLLGICYSPDLAAFKSNHSTLDQLLFWYQFIVSELHHLYLLAQSTHNMYVILQ